jgi:hypothetical protein
MGLGLELQLRITHNASPQRSATLPLQNAQIASMIDVICRVHSVTIYRIQRAPRIHNC